MYSIKGKIINTARRALALAVTAALTAGMCSVGVSAADIRPDCDETYYATLDYYGALTDSSVVKSYRTYGSGSITDYGSYSSVTNLSDERQAVIDGDAVRFDLSGDVPERFYFEGKTARPYDEFPWKLSLSYKLNGVPTPAENLYGEKGVVEITLDAVPNLKASDYSRNNLVLMATSMFNGDEILSLEAPGAQIQLLGNLYTVLYAVLPGEEQHFTISVGSDEFSYGGMIFMAVPATLEQLEQVSELRDAKDEAEDSYRSINDSLDAVLDSMEGMSDSLNAAAGGLESLNYARGTISGGKNQVYGSVDTALEAAGELTEAMNPTSGHLSTAAKAVGETKTVLNEMNDNLTALRPEVEKLKKILQNISRELDGIDDAANGGDDYMALDDIMESMSGDLDDLYGSLGTLGKALGGVEIGEVTIEGMTVAEIREKAALANQLHGAYDAAVAAGLPLAAAGVNSFKDFLMMDKSALPVPELAALPTLGESDAAALDRLYNMAQDPGFEDQLDQLEQVNGAIGDVSESVGTIAGPAGKVLGDLRSLTGTLKNLSDTLSDVASSASTGSISDAAALAARVSTNVDTALEQLDSLNGVLNTYEPELQTSLSEAQTIADSAAKALGAISAAAGTAENLLRQSGGSLDAGTQQALYGLASALRKSTNGLEQTDSIREAMDTLDALITDQWDSHAGGDNNLLLMDATAAPQSLTDSRNEGTASIQYVMRSQEITEKTAEQSDGGGEQQADRGTFWSRVKQMFQDIWNAIKNIF